MSRLRMIILVVLALGFVVLPVMAQNDVDAAYKLAADALGKALGKKVVTDNYTYVTANYPDSSLGCPVAGQTYQPGPFGAYRFTLLYAGVNYDVRVSFDETLTVICTKIPTRTATPPSTSTPSPAPASPVNTTILGTSGAPQADDAPPTTLSTYRNQQFSIAYPDSWQATERSTDVYFGTSIAPICAQPGMSVTALGPISGKQTADSLLDDYLGSSAAVGANLQGNRGSLGNTGRSVIYVSPCANGQPRQSRMTVFVAYGNAYRVWQFAPQEDFGTWDPLFLKGLDGFSPAAGSPGANGGNPVTLPTRSPLALLAHIFAGNVYAGSLTNLPGTPITLDAASDHVYRSVSVSPTGKDVAYIDPASGTLYAAGAKGGQAPRKIADSLVKNYPAAWSPDGSEIAYLVDEGAKDGDKSVFSVKASKADGSATRKIGNTVGIQASCADTNTNDPAEQLYWSATGPNGNALLLAWAQTNMVYYSVNCNGVGVGQLAADGSSPDTIQAPLRRVHVSPDGTQLLGITDDQPPALVSFNLANRVETTIPTSATPDQVVWSPDGKAIFYSTIANPNQIILNDDAQKDRGMKAFGVWPFQTTQYELTLHYMDLATGTDTQLYKRNDRSIAEIAPSPDGSGVVFLMIQDGSNLVTAFNNNVAAGDLQREAPNALLYWLPLPSGQAQLLAITLDPTWGPLGSALAPTPTGNPKNIQITPNVSQTSAPAGTAGPGD